MTTRALVVGGTSGIGYGMACRVAVAAGNSVVTISGRTKPQDIPHTNINFRPLEATSMRQIKQYTDDFKAQGHRLDLLIMTQGIMTTAGRTETPEGIDRKMALHYYGKQLLIRELLPVLKEDAKLGSPDKLIREDLDLKTHFSLSKAADHCISMNDAMVQYFASQQKATGAGRRHFVHAFPGGVKTSLWRDLPWYLRTAGHVLTKLVGVSADTCAEYLMNGVAECSAAGEKEERFWSNIDNKGRFIAKKAIWSDEQMKVADHTWGVIDGALSIKV
ncbi:hypothetical protein ACHAPT_012172 [Fusarium lateritium]